MGVKVTERGTQVLTSLAKRLADIDGSTVEIGILQAEGDQPKKEHDGKYAPLTLTEVALFHEYGLGVPQRSFIGGYFDANMRAIGAFSSQQVTAYASGRMEKDQCLSRIGAYCQGGIQRRIANEIPPPLAESTIKAKGSSVPLIDTGQLRTSITFKIGGT